jgi:hypothetical protein
MRTEHLRTLTEEEIAETLGISLHPEEPEGCCIHYHFLSVCLKII